MVSGDLEQDIQRYQQLLRMLLNRTEEAAFSEQLLKQSAAITAVTVASLNASVARFEASITNTEQETQRLTAEVLAQEALLRLLHSRLSELRQLLEGSLLEQLLSAQKLHLELQTAVSIFILHFSVHLCHPSPSQLSPFPHSPPPSPSILSHHPILPSLAPPQLDQLAAAAQSANSSSYDLLSTARNLLARSQAVLMEAREALALLCSAISLQNATGLLLEDLQANKSPALEALFRAADEALREANASVPQALRLSEETQSRILTLLSQEDYNVTMLRSQLQSVKNRSSMLTAETEVVGEDVARLRANASGLLETARSVLNHSRELDLAAADLLARAHGALEYANDSVRVGSKIISEGKALLEALRSRLGGVGNLSSRLNLLVEELVAAENLSSSAVMAANMEASVLAEAMTMLQSATSLLETVNKKLSTIVEVNTLSCLYLCMAPHLSLSLQLGREANATALHALAGATALNRTSAELAAQVSAAEDSLSSLKRQATTDSEAIAVANRTAAMAAANAEALLQHITDLNTTLTELARALNATELVSQDRLSVTSATVARLEGEVVTNGDTVAAVRNKIDDLEQSALELRARYRALQQHREVLQGILANIETLNCRQQFVSSS